MTTEQKSYCKDICPIGKQKFEEFLMNNNSPYDAALDMIWFVEKCFMTCERLQADGSKT